MKTPNIQLASKYHDKINKKLSEIYPDWDFTSAGNPISILSEAIALSCAEIENEIHQIPNEVVNQLPLLFGLNCRKAKPAKGIVKIIPKNLLKDQEHTLLDVHTEFKSVDNITFRSTDPVTICDHGEIYLRNQNGSCLIGLEKFPGRVNINLFVELENPLNFGQVRFNNIIKNEKRFISSECCTKGYSKSGYFKLYTSATFIEKSEIDGVNAFWLEMEWNNYSEILPVRRVIPNVVEVENIKTLKKICLGPGTARPHQEFTLPSEQVFNEFTLKIYNGEFDITETWHCVESFFLSNENSSHFTFDTAKGVIKFGDGVRGRLCPVGFDNVVIESLELTNGSAANLDISAPIHLEKQKNLIDRVEFVDAPTGGTNYSDSEKLYSQFSGLLKNKDRAITLDDFINISMTSSPRIGKVYCQSGKHNIVNVYPLIKAEYSKNSKELDYLPIDSDIYTLKEYLEDRVLIGTRVNVEKLSLKELLFQATIYLKQINKQEIQDIRNKIREYFSVYSEQGLKVAPGINIDIDHLTKYIMDIENVFFVKDIFLIDNRSGVSKKIHKLNLNELPSLKLDVHFEEGNYVN
ncbi:MAG: baseplate J/gp47 family protein [Halobacteriovoraceae bacterium]|nr:baseplate J/gp47 family protein [Halobacteriovoraceae bacterium]